MSVLSEFIFYMKASVLALFKWHLIAIIISWHCFLSFWKNNYKFVKLFSTYFYYNYFYKKNSFAYGWERVKNFVITQFCVYIHQIKCSAWIIDKTIACGFTTWPTSFGQLVQPKVFLWGLSLSTIAFYWLLFALLYARVIIFSTAGRCNATANTIFFAA